MESDFCVHWLFYAGAAGWLAFSLVALTVLLRYEAGTGTPGTRFGVSVVIAARNELENLKVHLPGILGQHHRPVEVIVVNDRSHDGSQEYLGTLAEQYECLRVLNIASVPPHIHSKKYALQKGAEAASHDILLFTDADCAPASPAWIGNMAAPFADNRIEVVLGYSQYFKRKGWLNRFIRFETLTAGLTYTTMALAGVPYMGVGRNIAYRRHSFLFGPGYGPHSHTTGGDDDLMVQRLADAHNTAVCLHEEALVYSVPEDRFRDYCRQKVRHLSVGLHYRMLHKILLAWFLGSKILFWSAGISAVLSGAGTVGMAVVFFLTHFYSLAAILLFKRKTADKTGIWMIPVLELFFIIYYISAGLAVLGTKKITWK